MAWRKIAAGAHRVMPWKNGGGSTAEIAIGPPGATVAAAFDWRLSIATIERDGPFSAFPGYDRLITLLSGKGMSLTFDGAERHDLDRPFRPLPFAGEQATDCRLIGGTCEDLNLMVARGRLAYRFAMLEPGARWRLGREGKTRLLFLFRGAAALEGGSAIGARDTLIAEPGDAAPQVDPGPGALGLLVVLTRTDAGPTGDQAAER